MIALGLKGLTRTYGDLVALEPLDLTIKDGEAVVLIGHNGSGKTTMMRMVAGLLDKTDGDVAIGGHTGGSLEARAKLAYLSDQPTFYDDLSVWEHLELVARLHGNSDWEQEGADLLGELVSTSGPMICPPPSAAASSRRPPSPWPSCGPSICCW